MIWRWMRARRPTIGGVVPSSSSRVPSPVDWSRFAGTLRTIETTRFVGVPVQRETTRTIREFRTVKEFSQPDLNELRKIESVLTDVNLQLENAIRAAM